MQAVILAAGRGRRMKKLTKSQAKPMLKIKGKPILEHKIELLPKKIKEVVLVVGYQSGEILKHFKNYFCGRKITYVFQGKPNGTGGALHSAKSILREKFLVLMGDDLYHKKDLEKMLIHDLAILAREVDDLRQFGAISLTKSGHLSDVLEKSAKAKKGLANTGAYVLDRGFFQYELVSIGKGEFGLPQTLAKMAKDRKVKVEKASVWHPISAPDDIEKAKELLKAFGIK